MRRRELLASGIGLSLLLAAGQDGATVIVIGTVHSPTASFSADNLVRVLRWIKPAAILFESDSSFFDAEGRLGPAMSSVLEGEAVMRYQRTARVLVLPYDIDHRNEIYAAFHYFEAWTIGQGAFGSGVPARCGHGRLQACATPPPLFPDPRARRI